MTETRDLWCFRCGAWVPMAAWLPSPAGDHLVLITGPLTLDRVATDVAGNTVTYRASEPFITVACSEYAQTVAALNIEIEVTDGQR